MKTTLATKDKPMKSVSLAIGKDGGCIWSSGNSISIPEGAVSMSTTFTLETHVDPQLMPPIDVKKGTNSKPGVPRTDITGYSEIW